MTAALLPRRRASTCLRSSPRARSRPAGHTDDANTVLCPSRTHHNVFVVKMKLCITRLLLLEMWTVPIPPQTRTLRILSTAKRPPVNPSVTVTDGRPMTLRHLNKWNGSQKEKYSASSNIKLSITDELETRSCFITRRRQSPLLSLGIWERCPNALLSLTTGSFSQEKIETDHKHSRYNAKTLHVVQCQHTEILSSCAVYYLKMNINNWSLSSVGQKVRILKLMALQFSH